MLKRGTFGSRVSRSTVPMTVYDSSETPPVVNPVGQLVVLELSQPVTFPGRTGRCWWWKLR